MDYQKHGVTDLGYELFVTDLIIQNLTKNNKLKTVHATLWNDPNLRIITVNALLENHSKAFR